MKRLDEIFDLRYGHSLELNRLTQVQGPAGVNFVSRAMGNNGVTARVLTNTPPGCPGEITVALGGNVLASFVQPEPFVCGRDVMILTARDEAMPLETKLWYCACIWANRYRYNYGRQANRTLGSLLVPDDPPAWVATKQVPSHVGLQQSLLSAMTLSHAHSWSDFPLEDLFDFQRGKPINKRDRSPGTTLYVGAAARNNGVTDKISSTPNFGPNFLTVAYDGSIGETFYHQQPIYVGEKVQALIPKEPINLWVGLFLATAIRFEAWRFNYGYKWNSARMKKTTIRLPVVDSGQPDWNFMARFMKGLPFSAALADEVSV